MDRLKAINADKVAIANATIRNQINQKPQLPPADATIPLWQEPQHPIHYVRSSELQSTVDFLILGSGVAGCGAARELLESGLVAGLQGDSVTYRALPGRLLAI